MGKHKVDTKGRTMKKMEKLGFRLSKEEFLRLDLVFQHTQKHTNFVAVEMKSSLTRNSVYATIGECLYHLTKPCLFTDYRPVDKVIFACPFGSVEDCARKTLDVVGRFELSIEITEV